MPEKQPEVMGIVGMRSGSKSLPDKNIRPLAGKPLVGWILEAAQRARRVSRLIVSTDSEKYAKVARDFGAETPFIRPAELATDEALDIEFIRHALDWLDEKEGYKPDIVVRLLATVPFQSADDIDSCVDALIADENADA